jgi:hypothetical protein
MISRYTKAVCTVAAAAGAIAIPVTTALVLTGKGFAQQSTASVSTRSLSRPFPEMQWRKQAPELPTQITDLWGDSERDGGFGRLVQMPPGFDSGLHAHSGDFHGVLISGTWVHINDAGKGEAARLGPGSYVRQAGAGMHVDKCVSQEPCVLFLFQFSRADVIWPPGKNIQR